MTISPAPKPATREKKKAKPIQRSEWLKRGDTPIPKVNVRQAKNRAKLTRKFHETPAFIAAGEAAYVRSGGRCEVRFEDYPYLGVAMLYGRCEATEHLERHCKSYPKTRPIEAKDILICCPPHHQFVEMTDHPTRQARRRVVARA